MSKSPAIIGQQKKSAPFRARDVRANILELGFERGIEMSLTLLADEMVGMRQTVVEVTNTMQQLIGIIEQQTIVNGSIAQTVDEIKRKESQYDESRGAGIIPSSN